MNVRKKNPAGILLTVVLLAALLTICLELGLSYLRPDTPGSIPKHLIHFAVMFALLGGAVLLCLFCPPFKKLWAWIDQHILDKETRPIAIDIIYAIITGLMLLHHFYVILYYPTIPAGATKFAPIWIILAAITVLLGKSWKCFDFYLATAFLIYTFERTYTQNMSFSNNDILYFVSAIYALFICLRLFLTLRRSIRKGFLQIFCALWTISTLILSIMGLYTAWTGISLVNLSEALIRVIRGRLWIFSRATITASYLSTGIIMALIGFAITKRKSVKISFLILCLFTMIANSLTDCRSSFLMISFMLTGMIAIGLWTLYRNHNPENSSRKKTVLIICSLVLCFVACFIVMVEGQRYLATSFVETRNKGNILLPIAKAEETTTESATTPPPPDFKQRDVWISEDVDINLTLNGRYVIWQQASHYIQSHPHILLNGLSVDGSVSSAINRPDHAHNILLQILLEGGIPALFLFLTLIFYFIYHTFRLWNRKSIPFWHRILPLPVFSILLWEMADCLTHFSYGHPPMTLFWFFLGATITVSKSLGKDPKAAEQPAIPAESAVTETGE